MNNTSRPNYPAIIGHTSDNEEVRVFPHCRAIVVDSEGEVMVSFAFPTSADDPQIIRQAERVVSDWYANGCPR